jgi:hypothetical protein
MTAADKRVYGSGALAFIADVLLAVLTVTHVVAVWLFPAIVLPLVAVYLFLLVREMKRNA